MNRERIETIIIGGGQAGLAVSYWLQQYGREHLVLEASDRPAQAWRQRWDSFTLVTPNWCFQLSGAEYAGNDPDGFMPRDEIIATFERYVADYSLPVRFGAAVAAVEPLAERPGYLVRTQDGEFEAANAVIATGLYQRPKIPAFAAGLPGDVLQLHSGQYRHPGSLPPGAVLVVGSGQSGCQIAEELYRSGRQVYLSIGGTGRGPRRYRGHDIFHWLIWTRFLDRTPDMLPSSKARFTPNPQVSGAGGGHDLNLHQFARDGVTLLGHVRGGGDGALAVAADRNESLAKSEQTTAMLIKMIDGFIAKTGMDAPEEHLPELRDGYSGPEITELNLAASGITSVIWAAGYTFDFDLVKLPVLDGDRLPLAPRGVTDYPGLYFVGLPWLYKQKSGLLMGVGEDAAYLAAHIAARER